MSQIGLFGFGCVGQGLYEVLNESSGFHTDIKKICIRDAGKQRRLPAHMFTTLHEEITDDPDIQLVVELIDDADAAWRIAQRTLEQGKTLVSAGKKMIAHHLTELTTLQERHGGALLYEGSVCGSIPILRNLEEYYDNESLAGISGIFNGSSNYILTKMFREGLDYAEALGQAQALGFAETDPWLDVAGYDAKYKLTIAAAHAFGLVLRPEQILNLGIQNLSADELAFGQSEGWALRLVARAQRVADDRIILGVIPQWVPPQHWLYNVNNEYNAVIVESAFAQQQLFLGKGAGGHPTGAAVLSDISARQYDYKYEYKKIRQGRAYQQDLGYTIPVYAAGPPDAVRALPLEAPLVVKESAQRLALRGRISIGALLERQGTIERTGIFIAGMEWV